MELQDMKTRRQKEQHHQKVKKPGYMGQKVGNNMANDRNSKKDDNLTYKLHTKLVWILTSNRDLTDLSYGKSQETMTCLRVNMID